jgi:hypothetical protein
MLNCVKDWFKNTSSNHGLIILQDEQAPKGYKKYYCSLGWRTGKVSEEWAQFCEASDAFIIWNPFGWGGVRRVNAAYMFDEKRDAINHCHRLRNQEVTLLLDKVEALNALKFE